jgi:hypothetical protein
MLKERIVKARDRLAGEFSARHVAAPKEFSSQLTRAATQVVNMAARELSGGANAKQVVDALTVEDVRRRLGLAEIETDYAVLHSQRERLLHAVSVEDAADLREKFRFFAFRMLLAVGIAAVVLLTGYVAKVLEIPLPMLRFP